MNSKHEDIRHMLPEYRSGGLTGDQSSAVEYHLAHCAECSAELGLMDELLKEELPDPGADFWHSLPKQVAGSAPRPTRKPHRFSMAAWRIFFAPAPVAALALLLALVFVARLRGSAPEPLPEAYVSVPVSVALVDYSGIDASDIPVMTADHVAAELAEAPADSYSASYYRELVSLSAEELELLNETMREDNHKGG